MKYRKRETVVEAFQMTEQRRASNADWPAWLHEAWNRHHNEPGALFPIDARDLFLRRTADRMLTIVHPGDWIVRHADGTIGSVGRNQFEEWYEPVHGPVGVGHEPNLVEP